MDKRFGECKTDKQWRFVKFKEQEESDDEL